MGVAFVFLMVKLTVLSTIAFATTSLLWTMLLISRIARSSYSTTISSLILIDFIINGLCVHFSWAHSNKWYKKCCCGCHKCEILTIQCLIRCYYYFDKNPIAHATKNNVLTQAAIGYKQQQLELHTHASESTTDQSI